MLVILAFVVGYWLGESAGIARGAQATLRGMMEGLRKGMM